MRQVRKKRGAGFTLIELLVVIAIIAVLVSLLLPAVQQAREAARRAQCKNNLKQLGLSLMNYESSYNVFPMEKITFAAVNQTWTLMVLPFLDQQPLYNMYNFSVMWADPSQYPVTTARVPVWVCPSAPPIDGRTDPNSVPAFNPAGYPSPPNGYGACDYMALSGVRASLYIVYGLPMPPMLSLSVKNVSANPGPISQKENRWPCAMHSTKETKISEISDGTSNTMMIAEDAGRPGVWRSKQKIQVTGIVTGDGWGWADTGNSGAIDGCTDDGTIVNSASNGDPTKTPPVLPSCAAGACPGRCLMNCNSDSEMFSFHMGGVQTVFADGSVHFLSDNISAATLGALLTRNGGDIPGDY
jgi:prepilin-type N-terminal cleavage/methylation domain-containing protein/prepilin-type processing-associated H-X9-DG protein